MFASTGIHFDVDSARIQPQSEATIAQIAQVLALHRDWKMRVEGHTDSDVGAAYNKGLSVRRAQAVVAESRDALSRLALTAGVGRLRVDETGRIQRNRSREGSEPSR